jgi:hypothetical protein
MAVPLTPPNASSRAPIWPLYFLFAPGPDGPVGEVDTSRTRFRLIIASQSSGCAFCRSVGATSLALLFPVVASGDQLVHDLLASWRGEP